MANLAWYSFASFYGDATPTSRLSPARVEAYGADTAMRLHASPVGNDVFVVLADGTAMRNGAVETELDGGIVQVTRGSDHTLVLKAE